MLVYLINTKAVEFLKKITFKISKDFEKYKKKKISFRYRKQEFLDYNLEQKYKFYFSSLLKIKDVIFF